MRGKGGLAAVLVLIIACGLVAVAVFRPLSLVPGPEGLDIRFYGFNPWGDQCWLSSCVYSVNGTADPPYYWVSRSPYTASFGVARNSYRCRGNAFAHVCVADESWELKVNVGTPMKVGEDRAFTYWVNESGHYVKVVAWREVYEVPVEIVAVPKKGLVRDPYGGEELWFAGAAKGVQLWFALGTVVWNRAVPDPDNPAVHSVNVFNVPIAVYVESSEVNGWEKRSENSGSVPDYLPSNVYNFVVTSADASGRRIALYTEPSDRADVLQFSSVDDVRDYVAGDPRPDSRFRSVVFFPITLNQFGAYYEFDCGGNIFTGYYAKAYIWYPAKTIRLRIIYLRFGKFVYTVSNDRSVVPSWGTESPHYATASDTQPGLASGFSFRMPNISWSDPRTYLILLGVAGLILVGVGLAMIARPKVSVSLKR